MVLFKKNVSRSIARYSTANTADVAYIIGGDAGYHSLNIVAEFKQVGNAYQWQRLADLKKARQAHGSISVGDKTMIIGGHFVDFLNYPDNPSQGNPNIK